MTGPLLREGYAALNDVPDQVGDRIRAGAFSRSLRGGSGGIPMLLQHKSGAIAGHWTRITETGIGLMVRGLVEAPGALALVRSGLDGLSIGFRPRLARPLADGGRDLIDLDLVEISLVAHPMQPAARFKAPGLVRAAA